ncbi:hypothetical protein SELMODRAFT_270578 [Selaginella moellendorffii]|uniref:Uncharacterized protein n=1 Tax=Selaginella moellendorffii TaxID=88036 RepID=D8R6G6_SELML|nr:uncharacterized protein LOC9633719 [Selaginella moellendorffii]EFJ32669.1 hypothetical protein SELMODRAFT_270578 [Selaginella moellendorffii]|eukprot:XP_002966642.1 uncharacterized protein LOC9633719 [Selaginella moellendorffii]
MVKLVSSRTARLYAPGGYRELLEGINGFIYVLGAVLILAGLIFQLPSHENSKLGLILALTGSILIFLVNLHDLYAHLAGVDFKLELLKVDPQYILVEIAVPVVTALGSFLVFLGLLFLLLTAKGRYSHHTRNTLAVHGLRMLIAGPALWLLASIHNIFQLYERASLGVQAYERGVTVCFVIASTLLLCGGVIGLPYWPKTVERRLQSNATWFAILGAALLVLGGIVNLMRISTLQRLEREGPGHGGEFLRGGAQESLNRMRGESGEPFLEGSAKHREDVEGGEGRSLYKDVVAGSPERLY